MQELLSLSRSELAGLAAAVRTGRLSAPYTATAVGRFVLPESLQATLRGLQSFIDAGMSSTASASVLDVLAVASTANRSLDELIDLVITGPTASAIGRDTAVVVNGLFRRASKSVVVVGYAISGGREVFRTLAERINQHDDIQVRFYLEIQRSLGDTSSESAIVQRFMHRFVTTQWPENTRIPEVYYDPRALAVDRADRAALHAKCVVIDDKELFVSSANFTEYAQQRNIEMGLCVRSEQVAYRITSYMAELVEEGKLQQAPSHGALKFP